MFACSDPDRKRGKGHAPTFVYGQIPSPPEGDGKVTCLVGEARKLSDAFVLVGGRVILFGFRIETPLSSRIVQILRELGSNTHTFTLTVVIFTCRRMD